MNVSDLAVRLEVNASVAEKRIEWLRHLPPAVQRFIPIDLAVWWVLRGVEVSVR